MQEKTRPVTEIMAELAAARAQGNEIYEFYKSVKVEEEKLRFELEAAMQEMGVAEVKTRDGRLTAYFSKRKSALVYNPDETSDWLLANDFKLFDCFKPDNKVILTLANNLFKEKGEDIPGVEVNEKTYMSLKENKPKGGNVVVLKEGIAKDRLGEQE